MPRGGSVLLTMSWHSFPRLLAPSWDWVQVEVTTHCQAACLYCPRTVYRDRWENRHLDASTFRRLLPDLKRSRLVYLQGWGEPFLHPEFLTLAALARDAGCQVGVTTNGMLLDDDLMARLVDLEIAVVAFSLAGVEEANDAVRRGTSFARVLENIRRLGDIKARKGAALPQVHVAYMLLFSGLRDLRRLPSALAGLGVGQVVVSSLDFVAGPALAEESLKLFTPEAHALVAARLDELAASGRRHGLTISHHLPTPGGEGRRCPENVGRACFVDAAGTVAPCVFLGLPVEEGSHITREGTRPYGRQTFGSLDTQALREIWRGPAYRRWRREFFRGLLPPACRGCLRVC